MKTVLYYYSGSGNSLWTARLLASELGDTDIRSVVKALNGEEFNMSPERCGIVFPIHMWSPPPRILDFVNSIPSDYAGYLFTVAVNAGQPALSLPRIGSLLKKRGLTLMSGYSIVTPSCYLPFGEAVDGEKREDLFRTAQEKIRYIAKSVNGQGQERLERGGLLQSIVFSMLGRMTAPVAPRFDGSFSADENCTSCGACVRLCPAENIELKEGLPVWLHRCEQCFSCLNWCPEQAIQYGKKTSGKRRYHHPEIQIKEMYLR